MAGERQEEEAGGVFDRAYLESRGFHDAKVTAEPDYVYLYQHMPGYTFIIRMKAEDFLAGRGNYRIVACVPRVHKDAGGMYYVEHGGFIKFQGTLDEVVEYLEANSFDVSCAQDIGNIISSEAELKRALQAMSPTVSHFVVVGFDGGQFVDRLGVIVRDPDVARVAAELSQLQHMLKTWYGPNADNALLNAALFVPAIVAGEALRGARIRYIVYNRGEGAEGKTLLFNILLNMLCKTDECNHTLLVYFDGAVNTEAQLRNLVALHSLPLILDEQTRQKLVRNSPIFLSVATGRYVGIHAKKYGLGFETVFRARRPLFIGTNVPLSELISEIGKDATEYAFKRRILYVEWESVRLARQVAKQVASYSPPAAVDFAAYVYAKHAAQLEQASDLVDFAVRFWQAAAAEFQQDYSEYLRVLSSPPLAEKMADSEEASLWKRIRDYLDPQGRLTDAQVFAQLLQRSDLVRWVSPRVDADEFFRMWSRWCVPGVTLDATDMQSNAAAAKVNACLGPTAPAELVALVITYVNQGKYPYLKGNSPVVGRPRRLLNAERRLASGNVPIYDVLHTLKHYVFQDAEQFVEEGIEEGKEEGGGQTLVKDNIELPQLPELPGVGKLQNQSVDINPPENTSEELNVASEVKEDSIVKNSGNLGNLGNIKSNGETPLTEVKGDSTEVKGVDKSLPPASETPLTVSKGETIQNERTAEELAECVIELLKNGPLTWHYLIDAARRKCGMSYPELKKVIKMLEERGVVKTSKTFVELV